jgi:hypothetical protein
MGHSRSVREYDLVLVLGFFRRLTYYLNIIKYLSAEFRIGLLPVPLEESLRRKHRTTQEAFTKICVAMGAEVAEPGPVSASVALVPQQPYTQEALRLIKENVICPRKIAMMGLAWAGLHDGFVEALAIHKMFVVHKALYDFLFRQRRGTLQHDGTDIVEVGLPYKKYPVFPDFQTDYLLAIPTPFSFPMEQDKWDFLEAVLSLFERLDPNDRVVHKPHNAVDYDYFSPSRYSRLAALLRPLPASWLGKRLRPAAHRLPRRLGGPVERLYTACLYQQIMRRVIPIEAMTPHHYCAMEAFLPGVRKGVIGGLSNTIWGALYFRLPFYNCVDIHRQNRSCANTLYHKDPTQLLDLNLRFFNIPYCNGKLDFDPKYFSIISDSTREADLLEALRSELAAQRTA